MNDESRAKTWLITGASSGLGRAMTEQLLERGDRVAATVRREDALADLQQIYRANLSVTRLDLADTASIRAAVEEAFAHWERIDVVVSNAAYGLVGAAEELTDAQIERQIAVNLTGTIPVHPRGAAALASAGRRAGCAGVVRRRTGGLPGLQSVSCHQVGH